MAFPPAKSAKPSNPLSGLLSAIPPPSDEGGGGEEAKMSPEEAKYQGPDQPIMCGNCGHFTPPTSCEIVSSPVEEQGGCMQYEPKSSPDEQGESPAATMGGGMPPMGPMATKGPAIGYNRT